MNKLTIKVCPVCGSAHIERAMTCIDHYASSEAFYLCRCQDCSFLFTQDFPVEAEILPITFPIPIRKKAL